MKYYAVKVGRKVGIFNSWEECKKQVNGFPNAVYKSFGSLEEAENFLSKTASPSNEDVFRNYAYIDGSFNKDNNIFSYAGIIFMDKEKHEFAKVSNSDYTKYNNVAGELFAAMEVINFALDQKIDSINIFYDYAGIEKWAVGEWEGKNELTKKYIQFTKSVKDKLKITFTKVKSHSGNQYNEYVDTLARTAIESYIDQKNKNFSKNDFENVFNHIKGLKKSINLSLRYKEIIITPDIILTRLKEKIKKDKLKPTEVVEIKPFYDIEQNVIVIQVSFIDEKVVYEFKMEDWNE